MGADCVNACQDHDECFGVSYVVGGRAKNLGNCHGAYSCDTKQPGPDVFYTYRWEECEVNPKEEMCLVQLSGKSKNRCNAKDHFIRPGCNGKNCFNNLGNQPDFSECQQACYEDEECFAFAFNVGGRKKNLNNCHGYTQCPKLVKGDDKFVTYRWEPCGDAVVEPIDGGFSGWSNWSQCSAKCGGGEQERTRECNNPTPKHGGANCQGSFSETRACNEQPCCQYTDTLKQPEWTCPLLESQGYDTTGCDCEECGCMYYINEGYECSAIEQGFGVDCSPCKPCQECECTSFLEQGRTCSYVESFGYDCSNCDCSETCDASTKEYLSAYGMHGDLGPYYTCEQMDGFGFEIEGCKC